MDQPRFLVDIGRAVPIGKVIIEMVLKQGNGHAHLTCQSVPLMREYGAVSQEILRWDFRRISQYFALVLVKSLPCPLLAVL